MTKRIPKLLRTAENQGCVDCGSTHGVVWAHSNLQEHGKGMGLKAHDGMGMWLCATHHAELDQGKLMSKAERREYILTMICRTYLLLWNQGLLEVNLNRKFDWAKLTE
jgi:hypothetical protein